MNNEPKTELTLAKLIEAMMVVDTVWAKAKQAVVNGDSCSAEALIADAQTKLNKFAKMYNDNE